jgi:hypothetical protein
MSTNSGKHWFFDGVSSIVDTGQNNDSFNVSVIRSEVKRYANEIGGAGNIHESNFQYFDSISRKQEYFKIPKVAINYDLSVNKSYFSRAQKWIGHIIEIDFESKKFWAKLIDLSESGTYEIGVFDFMEISPEDLQMLTVGAAFYWSLGFATNNGQVKKESIIRFQRFHPWSSDEFDAAADRANELNDFFGS